MVIQRPIKLIINNKCFYIKKRLKVVTFNLDHIWQMFSQIFLRKKFKGALTVLRQEEDIQITYLKDRNKIY